MFKEDFKLEALVNQYNIENNEQPRKSIRKEIERYLKEKYNEATAVRFIKDHLK